MAYLPNTIAAAIDPDYLYISCLHSLQKDWASSYPDISSLDSCQLLWMVTTSHAHAAEIAFRVFGATEKSDPAQVPKRTGPILLGRKLPCKEDLYDLWCGWSKQHSDWPMKDTLLVPIHFLACRIIKVDCMNELVRRRHHLPVFEGWMGLGVGPAQSDSFRHQRFLNAMDTTLRNTVHRRLYHTLNTDYKRNPSAIEDEQNIALLGAVERQHHAQEVLVDLFLKGGSITTKSGQVIQIPTIPVPPVRGMEHAHGMDGIWRDCARKSAFKVFAAVAPGFLGVLETALPDAAHAAQRAEHDRVSTKKRGGTGRRKAKKAETVKSEMPYVKMWDLQVDSLLNDVATLPDDRLTRQEELEAEENEAEAKEDARRAMRIAIDRWGTSGLRMLEALVAGATDKDAAKAAAISAPALIKRRKTLKRLLRS